MVAHAENFARFTHILLLAQMRMGRVAVNRALCAAVGALLLCVSFGNFRFFAVNCFIYGRATWLSLRQTVLMMWMHSCLALWRPDISLYIWATAPLRDVSRYSLYMFT